MSCKGLYVVVIKVPGGEANLVGTSVAVLHLLLPSGSLALLNEMVRSNPSVRDRKQSHGNQSGLQETSRLASLS